MIAWVQFHLTWELTGVAGFVRPAHLLASFSFPPRTGLQFALPEVFLGPHDGTDDIYWGRHDTIAAEACAYGGIVVWILAFVGAAATTRLRESQTVSGDCSLVGRSGDDAGLVARRVSASDAITRPRLVPRPARYTLLTSLGLALLAGRGLDRSIKGAAVLDRIHAGGRRWCTRMGLVDLLDERGRFPRQPAAQNARRSGSRPRALPGFSRSWRSSPGDKIGLVPGRPWLSRQLSCGAALCRAGRVGLGR